MTNRTIASLAGVLLFSTAAAAFAQGTTIVPSSQADAESAGAQNEADTATEAQAGGTASDSASQPAGNGGDANEAAQSGQSEGEGSDAAASQNGASGGGEGGSESAEAPQGDEPVTQAGDASNPEIDEHPSADSREEGNAVASVNAVDAPDDPGLALDSADKPVYAFAGDTPDWYTWRGYKKYGANCLQCHGPDGLGSSFAPNLTEGLQDIDYYEFAGIIVGGQQNQWNPSGNSIMPAWGEDPNVMCSLSAIYVYLRGRADGVVGRGEPPRPEKSDKSQAAQDKEYSCLGF